MSQFARVSSLDAIRSFKASLTIFSEQADMALSESVSDVQRTIFWIQSDRRAHWQREIKKRTEKVNQAKAELFKKQLESNDSRTSAITERKNLAKAQAALDEAEQKLALVKKWSTMLERELMLFKAGLAQVSGAVAGEVPAAIGRMEKMIASLEAYLSLEAPTRGPSATPSSLNQPPLASATAKPTTPPTPSNSESQS